MSVSAGPTNASLLAALCSLGSTPQKIADRLFGLGHRGVRRDGGWCPVAGFLRDRFPGSEPHVGQTSSTCGGADIGTPLAVAAFVADFDADVAYTRKLAHPPGGSVGS